MTTMLIISRGSSASTKYIMKDLSRLIPSFRESKFDNKNMLSEMSELMDMNECEHVIYFETTKRAHHVWISSANGPTMRFNAFNMFSMGELRFLANSRKDGGHVLLFTKDFEEIDELKVTKKLFQGVFGNPKEADRALCFFYLDEKIWIRNYVIEDGELKEMGPRMVLELDRIYEGCFNGSLKYKRIKEKEEK
ncbi:Ribosome biogenesis protein brx1 [Astathelohania contejeani]|uniref:Ribosome biogenesis protein brx1 n=1 Tax=Astathelohania contejeani TaxID=164912 RepID=A0ABQ7I207_9MICR|nr:Ribosome biogenesis protein brx1 [Thelohania contejeani]